MSFAETLSGFFQEFGVNVAWMGANLLGIYDAEYADPLSNRVEGSNPVVQVPTADVVGIRQGQDITVDSRPYKVRGVRPDGTGITLVELEAQ